MLQQPTFKLSLATIMSSAFFILQGCNSTPPKPVNNDIDTLPPEALNIDTITPQTITVSSTETWQSSGVFLDNGAHVTVKASGKWSPAPLLLQWSGAEGSSFFGSEIPYITGGALMARLGHDGTPFEVGVRKTFQANDYGMLYFAMNDAFDWLYDNEGELKVAVYSGTQSTEYSSDKKPTEVIAYDYNDKTGKGSLSARVNGDHFQTRNWMVKKIGEIASSKRVALKAGSEKLKGGSYQVLDENTRGDVLTIKFETLW